jgi:hypothetical protein
VLVSLISRTDVYTGALATEYPGNEIALIICSGNVFVTSEYRGLIICDGRITVTADVLSAGDKVTPAMRAQASDGVAFGTYLREGFVDDESASSADNKRQWDYGALVYFNNWRRG